MTQDDQDRVDIRRRLRAYHRRQLRIAALAAPADWQGALRDALAAERSARPPVVGARDVKLFLQSFLIFFTALMLFLS